VSIGIRQISVSDKVGPNPIPVVLFYPCIEENAAIQVGPYSIMAARDATPTLRKAPLVVISHGNSGSPWVHRDLAANLALRGVIVALPEHVGNSRSDNSLEGTQQNLLNRPRQLKLCVEAVHASEDLGPLIRETFGIGHSIGGYTILAAAGAKPYAGPHESSSGEVEPLNVEHTNMSSIVVLAPATPWFQGDDSFSAFATPTLMITGGKDEITADFHTNVVQSRILDRNILTHKVVSGAGHFSFQSPFPPQMTNPRFPPSQDPDGFDRAAYQLELLETVCQFFGIQ
jgi:predicted dienelactone hydrolase